MNDRREIIREYTKTIQPMGIVQVGNRADDRRYITLSVNIPGRLKQDRAARGKG